MKVWALLTAWVLRWVLRGSQMCQCGFKLLEKWKTTLTGSLAGSLIPMEIRLNCGNRKMKGFRCVDLMCSCLGLLTWP